MILLTTVSVSAIPVLFLRWTVHEHPGYLAEQSVLRTRCHTSAAVMMVSATAEKANQMMTITWNFWKCTNSGTLTTAMEVPRPPPKRGLVSC